MKNCNKVILFVLLFAGVLRAHAQEMVTYGWQMGVGAGYTNYYGDVSRYRLPEAGNAGNIFRWFDYNKYYIDQPSLSLLLQKKVTPTLGLMIQANYLSFSMSDRYRKKNGSIDTRGANYDRSLNFRTRLQDIGLAFVFNGNNGKLLPFDAPFYPSLFLGAGISKFTVKGDLYDQQGRPYNYILPGDITDGIFETNLRNMRTETDEKYPDVVPYVDLGISLNFRLHELFTLSLQSDVKYSASDYLDDVSRNYKVSYPTPAEQYAAKPGYNVVDPVSLRRGDGNSLNDFYINNRLVLTIGLSQKRSTAKRSFTPPAVYALGPVSRSRPKADSTAPSRTAPLRDTVPALRADPPVITASQDARLQGDSTQLRDSLRQAEQAIFQQLQSINSELRDIRLLLSEQKIVPRYQQLRFQADSILAMKNNISRQRVIRREDQLQMRIYDLQVDSLKNELQRLQSGGRPAMQDSITKDLYDSTPAGSSAVEGYYPEYQLRADSADISPANVPDTITGFRDVRRIDSLHERLVELQARIASADTSAAVARQDSLSPAIAADTAVINDSITLIGNRLRTSRDSINLLRRRLERASDSAAYYRRIVSTTDTAALQGTRAAEDKSWIRKIFESEKKKRKEEDQAAAARKNTTRQNYYDEQVRRMQLRMDAMEERNRRLQDDYETLDRQRFDLRRGVFTQRPVVIYDQNTDRRVSSRDYNEYLSLRLELERLRNEMRNANSQPYAERSDPAPEGVTDTVRIPVADSAYILSMRSELDKIRAELDSLRNRQPPATEGKPSFDVRNFPVISVYFNMGSAVLTSDQASRISPFAKVAGSNPGVKIKLKGFTDPVGNRAVNAALAEKRSAYVKTLLTNRFGISDARIVVEAPGMAPAGKRGKANPLDRRVDLSFE